MQDVQTKPNGPVAAVFVAAGIGSTVMGLLVVLAEISKDISNFLKFDANFGIGSGVGPLSGKALLATIAFFGSWIVLHYVNRGKEVDFNKWLTAALVLVLVGFGLTFPPIFEAIAGIFKSEG